MSDDSLTFEGKDVLAVVIIQPTSDPRRYSAVIETAEGITEYDLAKNLYQIARELVEKGNGLS